MITLAEKDKRVVVGSELFDSDSDLINCRNGTVDLRTGKLLEHNREHFITKLAPVAYHSQAQAPRWNSFLNRVLPKDLQEYLQTAVGYSAIGEIYEHILMILYGTGANGKSTFVEAIRPVMGDYAYRTSTESLMVSKNGGGNATPDVANLRGKRLVTASESSENHTLAESLIKDLTGGDMISARQLYSDPIQFKPTHTLWLSTNHKPLIKGTDTGIWRRIKLVPFTRAIPENEQDKKLLENLKEEQSGILNWIIDGAMKYAEHGLVDPKQVREATDEYRYELDRAAQFIDECCSVDVHFTVPKQQLYNAYVEWVTNAGAYERPEKRKHFADKLVTKNFLPDKSNGVSIWRGLKLKGDNADRSDKML